MLRQCLFCPAEVDPEKVAPEHIIPSSVDGTFVTYSICGKCNSIIGTEVDSELNRHRHIWDARKAALAKHPELGNPKKPFRFRRSWFVNSDGHEIRMDLKSNAATVHRTELPNNSIVFNAEGKLKDDEYYKFLLREKQRVGMSDEEFESYHLRRYLEWRENPTRKIYEDWLFNSAGVMLNEGRHQRISEMEADTPIRFIAKACVEFADILQFNSSIEELPRLSHFARHGGMPSEFSFRQDFSDPEAATPFHILAFTDSQFIVAFYGYFHVGVDISWKTKPIPIITANDIVNGCQRLCTEEQGKTIALLDRTLDIKLHRSLNLRSHIRK